MAYPPSVGCDLGGDQPTGYATSSTCFHTPEITITLPSESDIVVEITRDEAEAELFTSLQNEQSEYFSFDDWNNRTILRIYGSGSVLSALQSFLRDLSGRGDGYSYISEYSERYSYSRNSPEWRLHVEIT